MAMPKIAIVGAGPSGCLLARILSLSNVSVTIFEGEPSPDYRTQGGTIDLHPSTGLRAIKDAQLWDKYRELARFDGDYLMICDKDLKPLVEAGPSNKLSQRPEIDRVNLRRILIESLPEGTIRWGHRLQRVECGGRLVFEYTTESGFDLIVGCEGCWSKVRSFITDVKPYYTGVGYYRFVLPDVAQKAPDLYKLVKGGNIFSHANGRQFSMQQLGNGGLQLACSTACPEDWMETCGYDPHDLVQVKKALLREMKDWSPHFLEAIELAEGACESKIVYMLPIGWRWEHRRGITLIGDAAHLMAPYAGEGVNVAFDDARKLAAAVVTAVKGGNGPQALDKAVRDFEEAMFPLMDSIRNRPTRSCGCGSSAKATSGPSYRMCC